MAIGISLNVDAGRVREAKREVDLLNERLRETENRKDIELGGDRLTETSATIRRLSEDIRKLRGIAGAGERQGGVLRPLQLDRAERLSARVRGNFESLGNHIGRAREELSKLLLERDRLEKIGRSGRYESPGAFLGRQSRIQELEAGIAERRANMRSLGRLERRAGVLQGEAGEASGAIAGFGPGWFGGMGPAFGRRIMGLGLGLLGGLSVMSLLRDSVDQAQTFLGGEADLYMRGGRDLREGLSRYGYSPVETLTIRDALNRGTGLTGEGLNQAGQAAQQFSRGFGVSPDLVGSYGAGVNPSLGVTGPKFERHMNRLATAIEKGGIGGRVEDFLRSNAEILRSVSQGTGGRELTGAQADWLTGLQGYLWSQPGQIGKGESGAGFLGRLDQGIRSGGRTPGEKLFMFQALGGARVRSIGDYENLMGRMEQGIGSRDNLRAVLELARSHFGSDGQGGLSATGRLSLRSMFGLTVEQSRLASRMLADRAFDEGSFRRFIDGGDVAGRAEFAMMLPGNQRRLANARLEEKELPVGAAIVDSLNLLKKGALDAADGLGELTQRAREFLRPEVTPEERRRMIVQGVSSGSPWKEDFPEFPGAGGNWSKISPGGAGTGFPNSPPTPELLQELRRIGDLLERQKDTPQPVEVKNLPPTPFRSDFPRGSDK